MSKEIYRSENDLLVFISSRMNDEMEPARKIATETIKKVDFGRPWAFEFTPASAETAEATYLRKVREADFVLWLVGSETTQPVVDEINEAIASARRLLVIKLPAEDRDSQTNHLVDQVGNYAKWSEVDKIENLAASIRKAVADAIIQAVRNPFGPARKQKLLQDIRLSIYRCKELFVSLGVEESVAEEMANERERGNVLEKPAYGTLTVVGDQGSGKTLAVERLFQASALDSTEDSSQPFPVFIRARELKVPVAKHVEESLRGYTDPYNPRVLAIIDGVDELGSTHAMDVLSQVKAYVDANPEATVIATVRPSPGLSVTGEQIKMVPLEDEESLRLIEKVLGRALDPRDIHRWPQSIRDSRRIPLFAVMIGALLRHRPDLSFASSGQIIGQVADHLLRHQEDNPEELDRLLQFLAVQAIERGTRVNPSAISTVRAKQVMLKNSRMVEETSDSLDFALPVFREWYAARALIEGTVGIDHLQSISDRWIPSLSVVLGSEVDDIGESLLAHIVSSDPGLAGVLLKENAPDQIRSYSKIPVVENAKSAGTKVRESMIRWKTGLQDLYNQIGPVNAKSEVSPLAVAIIDRYLAASWHKGQSDLANVVELTDYLPDRQPNSAWPIIRYWEIEGELTGPSWWSYFKTYEELSDSLTEVLRNYSLASDEPEFRRELAWNFAVDVWQSSELRQDALGLEEVIAFLSSLGPNTIVKSYRGKDYGPQELEILAEHLLALSEQGTKEIANPWPSADLPVGSGSIWNFYSDERLLERVTEIYSGALQIYSSIVEKWFLGFSRRLSLYRILPVRLEGRVRPGQRPYSGHEGPGLYSYVRILSEVPRNKVSLELDFGSNHIYDAEFFDRDDLYQQEQSAFNAHRPGLPGPFSMTLTSSALSEVLHSYPATELAHSWLRRDLKKLEW